jgi:transposase
MGRNTRRSFSPEFRLEAASLVVDQGYSIADACEAMNVSDTAIRSWVKQLKTERFGDTPVGTALTAEQRRIQELEARIKRLEREKSILKKATALLMLDEGQHLR